ncbi:MAG: M24 family metallopeptidase [Beijerinckiaceae bacterium]|nr:M24 family metallopeptidase [Beijerinckiaceae bacterium]
MSMRTMHSVVKRGALYWDRDLLPESGYRARLQRVQAQIKASGDDAWIMMGDVERHGPVVYATNFMPRVRSALALIPRDGEPVLLANISTRDIPAAKTITYVDEIRAFGKISKDLVALLDERAAKGARIGLCGVAGAMPYAEWTLIAEARPDIVWCERDVELDAMRASKDEHEIAAIQRSADIVVQAFDGVREALRPGANLRAAMAVLERLCRSKGAEDARILVSVSRDGCRPLRPVHDHTISDGDIVLVFLAVQNQRYWADSARTFSVGSPQAPAVDAYSRCSKALAAMRAACRPGVSVAALESAARAALGQFAETAMLYGLGGGIGLDQAEGSTINSDAAAHLSEGQTLALRVIAHGPKGGAAIGETVRIIASGAEPLCTVPDVITLL